MEYQMENLKIINPNKNWVIKELDALIVEWEEWQYEVKQWGQTYTFDNIAMTLENKTKL